MQHIGTEPHPWRWLSIVFVVATFACQRVPPSGHCTSDEQCARASSGPRCIDARCQQCATNGDCAEGFRCAQSRCLRGEIGCLSDRDCLPSHACLDRRCTPRPECDSAHPCPAERRCDTGVCVAVVGELSPQVSSPNGACEFEAPLFAFNDSSLDEQARRALQRDAACLLRSSADRFVLVGRGDPRGTPDYNIQLGERRARVVARFLESLGVSSGCLQVVAAPDHGAGTDEASWRLDRRVDIERAAGRPPSGGRR
jgi:peptidoglycan-associated lipoprotein